MGLSPPTVGGNSFVERMNKRKGGRKGGYASDGATVSPLAKGRGEVSERAVVGPEGHWQQLRPDWLSQLRIGGGGAGMCCGPGGAVCVESASCSAGTGIA